MRQYCIYFGFLFFSLTSNLVAQNVGINEDGSMPNASAILDVKSNDKGLLIPRLTTAQRTAIAAPATGLIVYDTTTSGFWYYDGSSWVEIASGIIATNTLDDAYDQGGAGAGRVIDADAGALSIEGTDGFIVSGTFNSGATIGTPGAGAHLYFNPRKAAFRAGFVSAANWDDVAVGNYSVAMGYNPLASSVGAVAIGYNSEATNSYSTAVGRNTESTGSNAIALGHNAVASGSSSASLGFNSAASGYRSVAIGDGANASALYSMALGGTTVSGGNYSMAGPGGTTEGDYSFALGDGSNASGDYSVALGQNAVAPANNAISIGDFTIASGVGAVALGDGSDATGNASFAVGSNSMASGNGAVAMGTLTDASGTGSLAFGHSTTANGPGSLAGGSGSIASANQSFAFGLNNQATGQYSVALGGQSVASGNGATAIGMQTTASGTFSTAFNFNTTAAALMSTAFGRYNVGGGNPTAWINTDRLFEIGIGTSAASKANAFTVLKNGNTGIMNPNPDATLDVIGTFQLVDGNQAAGKVLTSDAAGNATWATPATGGNTLDQAYDQGGPGVGRTINAENGAVHINRNSSFGGTALEISVNSSYALSERSAINTTNSGTGLETYTNMYRTGGPPYGQGLYITNEASENIIGKDGVVLDFNEATTLNYLGQNRGFVYDATYNGGSSGSVYGYQANIEGSGSAFKYGVHITIPSTSGGTHYGIYSDVQKASGYAAYLLGRTSLGASTTNRYLMPGADGNAGQVMATDGVGNVNWSQAVAFSAYQSTSIASTSATFFPTNTEEFDTNNNFNPANATFTAPYDGIYQFNFVEYSDMSAGGISTLEVRLNGVFNRQSVVESIGELNHRYVFMMELSAGDAVQFDHVGPSRTMYGSSTGGSRCAVEGFLVR